MNRDSSRSKTSMASDEITLRQSSSVLWVFTRWTWSPAHIWIEAYPAAYEALPNGRTYGQCARYCRLKKDSHRSLS